MGKHVVNLPASKPTRGTRAAFHRPRSRSRIALFAFAFAAASGVVMVNVVDPTAGAIASPYYQPAGHRFDGEAAQTVAVAGSYETAFDRDGYEVVLAPKPTPTPTPVVETPATGTATKKAATGSGVAPVAAAPDPGSAKAIARDMLAARGMGDDQYSCLVSLWNKESGWRVNANNGSSGAYGIPQALPGSKMATAGADWQTNPATQITWGLGYITGRYGSPCGAWAHSQAMNWY
ncbi:hypothetical protein ALI44B_04025 [Leifsonia sp. ALI-44-B]|nr:hypothetical protein ALI44B_04025 [Leifsonia sp. ALI-44-B]